MKVLEHPQIDHLTEELKEIEDRVRCYTLADAIREGSSVTDKQNGWVGKNGEVCALSAAVLAVKARNII